MLKAWWSKDYKVAGAKWAHFWTLIIGAPEGYGIVKGDEKPDDEKEPDVKPFDILDI